MSGATDGGVDVPEAEHRSGAGGARDEWRAGDDAADGPEAEHRSGAWDEWRSVDHAAGGPGAEHRSGGGGTRVEWRAAGHAAAGPEAGDRSGATVRADGQPAADGGSGDDVAAGRADTEAGADVPAGRMSGLLAGARGLVTRVRRADRTALWVAAGVAVVVGLAVGTGAGVAVGTGQSAQPGTAVVTPTAGTVTVEQLLAAPQTYADQLPGAVDAPVMLRTTRLVFTNRSLSGDDAATPWAVWAGVGRDGKMICLVASADRLQGSSACYPREDALHGTVSMTAMSSSGTLWVSLKGGAVLATVTGSF